MIRFTPKELDAILADFLGKPLGEKSHHLLHTKYAKRKAADVV